MTMLYDTRGWRAVMTEIDKAALAEEPVRTWVHQRKGRIQGRIVADDGVFVTIEFSPEVARFEGERTVARKSFLTEVED